MSCSSLSSEAPWAPPSLGDVVEQRGADHRVPGLLLAVAVRRLPQAVAAGSASRWRHGQRGGHQHQRGEQQGDGAGHGHRMGGDGGDRASGHAAGPQEGLGLSLRATVPSLSRLGPWPNRFGTDSGAVVRFAVVGGAQTCRRVALDSGSQVPLSAPLPTRKWARPFTIFQAVTVTERGVPYRTVSEPVTPPCGP